MIDGFLGHFNAIDKHLDDVIGSDKFLPYNEKINKIAHGRYPLTPWVRHHSDQLKYLGDIRNLLIHHQGDEHNYLTLTQEAISDVEKISTFVLQPPTVETYMSSPLVACESGDLVGDVITKYQGKYGHIPVLDDKELIGGVSNDQLLVWIAQKGSIDMSQLRVADIPLVKPHHYHITPPQTSIVDAVHLFAERGDYHALLVYDDREYVGIITKHDVPQIVQKIFR